MEIPKKASEVLSRALEFWGPEMENWVAHTVGDGVTGCLYGGLMYGVVGRNYNVERQEVYATCPAYKKAKKLVLDEIERQGWPAGLDIVTFNDAKSAYRDKRDGTSIGNAGFVSQEERKARIKGVVCGALKRALEEEA